MSEIEQVVLRTRKLETLLREQYHAEGKGLHQLVTSCEERLPHDVIKKLRYVATIRNKIVHEDDYRLEDRKAFLAVCQECEDELTPRSGKFVLAIGFYADDLDDSRRHAVLLLALGRAVAAFLINRKTDNKKGRFASFFIY